jgi:hypothetical protein
VGGDASRPWHSPARKPGRAPRRGAFVWPGECPHRHRAQAFHAAHYYSLGLFALVINGFLLWLTAAFSQSLGLGFHVAGFIPAFWGALVIGITRAVLNLFLTESEPRD